MSRCFIPLFFVVVLSFVSAVRRADRYSEDVEMVDATPEADPIIAQMPDLVRAIRECGAQGGNMEVSHQFDRLPQELVKQIIDNKSVAEKVYSTLSKLTDNQNVLTLLMFKIFPNDFW